jgi:hypothetical protein
MLSLKKSSLTHILTGFITAVIHPYYIFYPWETEIPKLNFNSVHELDVSSESDLNGTVFLLLMEPTLPHIALLFDKRN